MGLSALFGGGLTGGSQHSQSGDASAGLTAPLQYNASFQVGGSGDARQDQSAAQPGGGGASSLLPVISLVIGIAGLGLAAYALSRK